MVGQALIFIALAGLLSSAIYLLLTLIAALRFRKRAFGDRVVVVIVVGIAGIVGIVTIVKRS